MWRRPDGRALVSTVDFFPPVVDDAETWGRIAAANAASDVYAMGGRPLFALNLAVWPQDRLPLELLAAVLRGGAAMAAEGGWQVVGGHTTEGPEPVYGQAVTGEVHADRLMRAAGAEAGRSLVLTKPLGTGIITTAHKRLQPGDPALPESAFGAAVAEMCRLNDKASELAVEAGVTGATDVTGFGLLGHLQEMCAASGTGAALNIAEVPLLPGVTSLATARYVPGGTGRNLEAVGRHLRLPVRRARRGAPEHPRRPPDLRRPAPGVPARRRRGPRERPGRSQPHRRRHRRDHRLAAPGADRVGPGVVSRCGEGPAATPGTGQDPRRRTTAPRPAVSAAISVVAVLAAGVVTLSAASLLVTQDDLAAQGARIVIVSFALGAIPFSNLLAQSVAGTDLRSVGSGTVSGTALYRVAGFAPLAIGGLMDIAKAVPGVLAAGSAPVVSALAAGAAVAGHNWSPFLRGAGGRGVSPAMGALAVVYWPGAVLLLAGLGIGRVIRRTGLASFAALVALPLLALAWGGRDAALAGAVVVAPMLLKRLTANNTVPPAGRRARVALRRLLYDNDGAP